MLRRTLIKHLAVLFALPQRTMVNSSPKVLAVSLFGGQGSTKNVDTGLRYNGVPVSPSFVTITPYGYKVEQKVGVFPHQNDTLIDVECPDVTWVGKAEYIE